MSLSKLKYEIQRLSKFKKIIGAGSLLVFLSVFFPWYKDLDAWGIGKQFSALSGPLYLIGFLIMALGAFSCALIASEVLARKKIRLPMKEGLVQMMSGISVIFFLIIVNSVFFHKDFGVNILRKETRFGMIVSFIGAVLIGIGGYIQNKKEDAFESKRRTEKEETESLIDLNRAPRTVKKDITKAIREEKKDIEPVNLKMDL